MTVEFLLRAEEFVSTVRSHVDDADLAKNDQRHAYAAYASAAFARGLRPDHPHACRATTLTVTSYGPVISQRPGSGSDGRAQSVYETTPVRIGRAVIARGTGYR